MLKIMYYSVLTLIVVLSIFDVNGKRQTKCGNNQKLVKLADLEKCMLKVVSLSKCITYSHVKTDDVCNKYQLIGFGLANRFNENQNEGVDNTNIIETESSTNGLGNESCTQSEMNGNMTSDEDGRNTMVLTESLTNGLENEFSTQSEMNDDVVTSNEVHTMEFELSTNCLEGESSTQTDTHQHNVLVGENQYLLAYYAFECDVKDTSGNERHGRSNGTDLTYTTGVSGLAANFTGSQSIVVDEFSNFDFGLEFTVSLWYKSFERGDRKQFILNNGFHEDGEIEIKLGHMMNDPNLTVLLFTRRESRFKYKPVVQFGVWRHVVLTYNGIYAAVYVNAQIQAGQSGCCSGQSDCCSGPIPINPNPIVIGTAHKKIERYFYGLIDEVQFYNSSVTSQQVEAYYYNVIEI
ncbi:uncharacterized protein [Antedon mediterranea]|uniref:uncharacterized protein n=1 Tax=Antedon mediterranea TaxID=105859 RepID=UPI003AF995D4